MVRVQFWGGGGAGAPDQFLLNAFDTLNPQDKDFSSKFIGGLPLQNLYVTQYVMWYVTQCVTQYVTQYVTQ